jgi:hypothetical protein
MNASNAAQSGPTINANPDFQQQQSSPTINDKRRLLNFSQGRERSLWL